MIFLFNFSGEVKNTDIKTQTDELCKTDVSLSETNK